MGIVRTLWSAKWRWLTITCLWVAVAALLQWGLLHVEPPMSFWDRVYLTPSIFSLGFDDALAAQDWRIQLARFLGPIIFATTFFTAAAAVLRTQVSRARLRFTRGHIVVAGLGDKGSRLVTSLVDAGRKVVVIERDPANPHVGPLRRRGVTVLDGDATDPEALREVNVVRAAHLVAMCEADGTNAEVADAARRLVTDAGRSRPLGCSVHLRDAHLSRLLRARELDAAGGAVRYDFFNIYQRGARRWLAETSPFDPDDTGRPPHLVVVGLDELGESLAVAAVQRWIDVAGARREPLTLTIVDPEAGRRLHSLGWQHPALVKHATLDAIDHDPARPTPESVQVLGELLATGTVTAVFVSLADETSALSEALSIRLRLAARPARVHVRTRLDSGLAVLVASERDRHQAVSLDSFGLLDRTCTADLVGAGTNEQVAEALHEDYLSRAGHLPEPPPWAIAWSELPDDVRESNRRVADQLVEALASIGCRVNPLYGWDDGGFALSAAEVEDLARKEHERWLAERRADGWTLGRRDNAKRTNPLLVEWDALDEAGREGNRETVRGWPLLLARAGFEVAR
jgi:hypothetical protein